MTSAEVRGLVTALRADPAGAREFWAVLLAAGALAAVQPTEWSTRAGHRPPGYARDTWKALARRIGTKRGRWWTVSAAPARAHEAGQFEPSAVERAKSAWSPANALRAAGLRG